MIIEPVKDEKNGLCIGYRGTYGTIVVEDEDRIEVINKLLMALYD